MSWWTLGEEPEEEEAAPIAPPLVRGGRGGRGRGPGRGRGGRGRSSSRPKAPPQLSDIPRQAEDEEEPESIFTTLGRTVNQYIGTDNDDNTTKNTTGSAKYTGAPVRARKNATDAELRANEMADAMAWLNSPEAAAVASADTTAGASDNWWEKDDDASAPDDVSVFSNATEFKTGDNTPDLMTMLKLKQEENAQEQERREDLEKDKKRREAGGSARNAKQQAKKMGDAVAKWNDTYDADGSKSTVDVQMDPMEEMKQVTDWWGANKDYVPTSDKAFDETKKKAMKVRKALDHVIPAEQQAEKKARELEEAVKWWQNENTTYGENLAEFEHDQSTFLKVNALFGRWELKDSPKQKWESFDPRNNREEAERRTKDLQGCLGMVLNGYFDPKDPRYNSAAINRTKALVLDWKFSQDNSASEMEEALRWWRLNANTFDPLTATNEDDEMFRKAKDMLALFGLKEGDKFDSRNKQMKAALKLWAKHKDTPFDQLEPHVADTMKKTKHALLHLHRDSLDANEMQRSALEMNNIMSWYQTDGNQIQDFKTASGADVAKFKKAQGLLTLWGCKVDPAPEQLKEIADSLIYFRRNHYKPEIFDQFEGEEGAKFKKLQQAMIDWRAIGAESSEISVPVEGEAIAKEIEGALDLWRSNCEEDDIPDFKRPADVYSAEKVKIMMEKWDPRGAENTMTWTRTKKSCKEIQDVIDLWRSHGKVFDVGSLDVKSSQREVLLKLREIMLEWRRTNASNISEVEAEQTVKEMINAMNWWKKTGKEYDVIEESLNTVPTMMRHKMVTDTLADWHSDLGMSKTGFDHLPASKVNQTAKDLNDGVGWWEREGNSLEIDQDLEDAEVFEKAKRLAQLWRKTNMPRKHKVQVVKEIADLFRWMRKKNKNFDLDSVKNKKVEDIRELFHAWGGKKNRKPKVVAREIEDALDWWRRNDFELDEDSSPVEEDKMVRLENFAQRWNELAHPDMEPGTDANLDWFRSQNVGEISESLNILGTSKPESDAAPQLSGVFTEEQKRASEMASALDWINSNDAELDFDDDISVAMSLASFKKIDSLMPKSGDSGGVTSMESALNWLRSKTDVDDETVDSFRKVDDVIEKSGAKDSIQESGFGGALDWLKKRQALKAADATGPVTAEQKKAAEMANALNWLKSNDTADDIDDDISLGVGSVASFKNIDTGGGGSLPSALDWLRKQEKETVPTGNEEDQTDNDLSFASIAKKNKEQKTAADMAKALDWLRDGVVEAPVDGEEFKSAGIGTFSPVGADGQESKGLDDALNWLREKHPESLSKDDENKFSAIGSFGSQPRSKEQQKAEQMSRALDWMRSNDVPFEDDAPDFSSHLSRYGSIDSERVDSEGTAKEMTRALDWLRDKDLNNLDLDDTSDYFGSVPKTKEQEQADAMAKALSWLRNKDGDGDGSDLDFQKFAVGDFTPKSGEERMNETQDALNWLRNSDVDNAESKKFQKMDILLPKKEGQSVGDRAKEMEDALNWLRSKGLDLDDDDTDVSSFNKLGVIPMGLRSVYEKDRDTKNALSWIRSTDDDKDNKGGNAFSKLDGLLPLREGQTEQDRATDMVNALAWLRTNGVNVSGDDDGSSSFGKIGTESIVHRSPEDREKDLVDALGWLRQGEHGGTDDSVFDKIQRLLPATNAGMSESERAKEMENSLNWLRSNGIDIDSLNDESIPRFDEVGSAAIGRRSSGSSSPNDVNNILNFLRNSSNDDTLDPSGVFQKLQSSLPVQKGQPLEERAQALANALEWMRQRGLNPTDETYDSKSMNVPTMTEIPKRSPEQRSKDMSDALNWLRNKGKTVENLDLTGDFSKLNGFLPMKRDQTLEDRAKAIEGALDWIREQGNAGGDDGDYDFPSSFIQFPSTSIAKSSPEQRLKDLENSIKWIRKGKGKSKKYDPTGDFRKLDKLLPKKRGQTPEERAREIEGKIYEIYVLSLSYLTSTIDNDWRLLHLNKSYPYVLIFLTYVSFFAFDIKERWTFYVQTVYLLTTMTSLTNIVIQDSFQSRPEHPSKDVQI